MNYPVTPVELRPRLWPLALFFIPFSGVFIYIAFSDGHASMTFPLIFAFIIFMLLLLVSRKKKIYLNQEGIGFESVFRKGFINWSNINSSFLKYERRGKSGSYKWVMANNNGTGIKVPMGFHSRADYRLIAETLRAVCPQATLEPRIVQMSEGIFPWYIF